MAGFSGTGPGFDGEDVQHDITDGFTAHCPEILADSQNNESFWLNFCTCSHAHHEATVTTEQTQQSKLSLEFCIFWPLSWGFTLGTFCRDSAIFSGRIVSIRVGRYPSEPLWVTMLSLQDGFAPVALVSGPPQWLIAPLSTRQVSLTVLAALRDDWSGSYVHCWRSSTGSWHGDSLIPHGDIMLDIKMRNLCLTYLLHGLKVENKMIYTVFIESVSE